MQDVESLGQTVRMEVGLDIVKKVFEDCEDMDMWKDER